jgi:hypothetical protein
VQAVRAHVAQTGGGCKGWLRALIDPQIGRAQFHPREARGRLDGRVAGVEGAECRARRLPRGSRSSSRSRR